MGLYNSAAKAIPLGAIADIMAPVQEAWFNANIMIEDPNIEAGSYNRKTNAVAGRAPTEIWRGPARIQAMRWPNVATTRQEAVSLRTVVFHFPRSTSNLPDLILEGMRVVVLDGGEQPEFEQGMFVITTAVNTSFAWDRRVEAMMDQGSRIARHSVPGP